MTPLIVVSAVLLSALAIAVYLRRDPWTAAPMNLHRFMYELRTSALPVVVYLCDNSAASKAQEPHARKAARALRGQFTFIYVNTSLGWWHSSLTEQLGTVPLFIVRNYQYDPEYGWMWVSSEMLRRKKAYPHRELVSRLRGLAVSVREQLKRHEYRDLLGEKAYYERFPLDETNQDGRTSERISP